MGYTLEDLQKAMAELAGWDRRADDSRSNNPNKQRGKINAARDKVDRIRQWLKDNGKLPLTEKEQLERELDERYPNAESNRVVEHQGKKYRRKYAPAAMSRSGKTVKDWCSWWEHFT